MMISDMKLEECKVNLSRDAKKEVVLYRDMNSDYYVLMYIGEDKKETMDRFISTGRCFGAFREDGSIYGKLEELDNQEEIAEKVSHYIFQHEGSPKHTIYIDYADEDDDNSDTEDEGSGDEGNEKEEEEESGDEGNEKEEEESGDEGKEEESDDD